MSILSSQAKTLTQARALIAQLQQKLGLVGSSAPIAKAAASLHPQLRSQASPLTAAVDLSALPPRDREDFFGHCTTADLRAYLATETAKSRKHQNPTVIASLYNEIKKRGRR